jgi:hypothetical protein
MKLNWEALDIVFVLLVIIFLGVFQKEYVVGAAFILCIPYLYISKRKRLLPFFGIAFGFAMIWGLIANSYYDYPSAWKLLGITIFPFLGWSMGLFAVLMLHNHVTRVLKLHAFWKELVSFALLFWILLLGIETLVYHVFSLKNVATKAYAGLPFCNCIHAPLGMQITYLLMGPLFFVACFYAKKKSNINQ